MDASTLALVGVTLLCGVAGTLLVIKGQRSRREHSKAHAEQTPPPGASHDCAEVSSPRHTPEQTPSSSSITKDRLTFLAVATEWDSGHGGISTFNRELCKALARLGYTTYCGVPELTASEFESARVAGVTLVTPERIPGSSVDAALSRRFKNVPDNIDVVIGHGRITGTAAIAQLSYYGASAFYLHFLHMDPKAIEWDKEDNGRMHDPSHDAQKRVDLEVELGLRAGLIVAVGPELHGSYQAYFHSSQRTVHEFLPGLFDSNWDKPPATDYRCLVFGRAEDRKLKGIDFCARTLAIVTNEVALRDAWLVVLGAQPGTGSEMRASLSKLVEGRLKRIDVQEYTSDRSKILTVLRSASLVLMLSWEEGFGLAGLEAISEGIPVLLTRSSGLAKALERRLRHLAPAHIADTGEGYEAAAAERVQAILLNLDEAYRRVTALREAMRVDFSWEKSTRELIEAIRTAPSPPSDQGATGGPPPTTLPSATQGLSDEFRRASEPLFAWPTTLKATGDWIPRPEMEQLLEHVREGTSRPLVLLGPPGSGKSALLAKTVAQFEENGVAVLAIKADRLPAVVDSQAALAAELDFPSGVAQAVIAMSQIKKTVLVIDQMDALADIADIQTQRLNVLMEAVDNVVKNGGVSVLMSCRTFDYNHDVRFARVDAASVTLSPPSLDAIDRLLVRAGVDPMSIPRGTRELVSNVHALDVYLQLQPAGRGALIETQQQLVAALWRERIGTEKNASALEAAAQAIATAMAEREEHWLTREVIDEIATHEMVESLQSRGLIVVDRSRYAFAHQTLFELARARAFLTEHSLAEFVLARQGALFIRPLIWTSLAYLRAVDGKRYFEQLSQLWSNPSLRRHVRGLLIEFIGQVSAPKDPEIMLFVSQLDEEVWRPVAIEAMVGAPAWFAILKAQYLPVLMRGASAAMTTTYLTQAMHFAQQDVADLIRANWLVSPAFHRLAASVLIYSEDWSTAVEEIAITIVKQRNVDSHTVKMLVRTATAARPNVAPLLVALELQRQVASEEGQNEATKIKAVLDRGRVVDDLVSVAAAAPEAFLQHVWGWFARAVGRISRDGGKYRYRNDYSIGTSTRFAMHELPQGIVQALQKVAEDDAAAIAEFVSRWQGEQSIAVHRFLIEGLRAGLPASAHDALRYLLGDPRRLNVGESSFSDGESVRLVRAISPLLSDVNHAELEAAVCRSLSVDSDELKGDEQLAEDVNRRHQLHLVRALSRDRTSDKVLRLIEAASAQGVDSDDEEDGRAYARVVEGRRSVEEFLRASDDEVLSWFEGVEGRGPIVDVYEDMIRLGRPFAEAAKRDPARFVALLSRFTPGVCDDVIEFALQSLSEVAPERIEEVFLELVKRGFFSAGANQGGVAYALRRASRREAPLGIVALGVLQGWLVDGQESAPAEAEEDAARGESILYGYGGGGALPGGNFPVLWALTSGYLNRPDPLVEEWVGILRAHLERPESAGVWKALAVDLANVLFAKRELAIEFLDQLFARYPSVRDSHDGLVIVARAMHRLPFENVERWMAEIEEGTWARRHQGYGELLVLLVTRADAPTWARRRLDLELRELAGSVESHDRMLGMAHSAGQLWNDPLRRAAATRILVEIIPRADERTAAACMNAFRQGPMLLDADTRLVLETLAANPRTVVSGNAFWLMESARELLPLGAAEICGLLMAVVAHVKALDNPTFVAQHGRNLVDIAMTLQRLPSPLREQGLDLFEDLLSLRVYEARSLLAELDPVRRPGAILPPRRSRSQRTRR